MPYPQVAGSRTRRTKNNTPLVERGKLWLGRVVELCLLCWFRILAKLGASTIVHPCTTRKLRVLAPAAPKSRAMPVCGSGSGAGLSNRACSVGFASCETLGKHYHASLRLRSLGSLHRAATLCDRHRASFARL